MLCKSLCDIHGRGDYRGPCAVSQQTFVFQTVLRGLYVVMRGTDSRLRWARSTRWYLTLYQYYRQHQQPGMSNLSSTELQTLLNGGKHESLQDEAPSRGQTEEHTPSASLQGEDKEASDKEIQVKMQSIMQQVRKQIRSQGGVRTPKSSILALVQKVWEKEVETIQLNRDAEIDNSEEERQKDMENQKEEEDPCSVFEEKLEASKKALTAEFEVQILQLRNEMQAYTDQAIKKLEKKMLSKDEISSPKEQPKLGPDKKHLSSAARPPVALRGRVLTRTMTTIIPKTCTPVIMGPRAKSETLASSKARVGRDNTLTSTVAKTYQSRRPLPPAGPRQTKRPAQAKTTTGN